MLHRCRAIRAVRLLTEAPDFYEQRPDRSGRYAWEPSSRFLNLGDETSLFEGEVGSALFHRFEALGRYIDGDLFSDLRHKKRLLLDVDLAAALAGRVELGRADAVRIPASNLGFAACYVAYACHICEIIRDFR